MMSDATQRERYEPFSVWEAEEVEVEVAGSQGAAMMHRRRAAGAVTRPAS